MKYVNSIEPYGTNSTMFTSCCGVAICDDEKCCPSCKEEVVGADEKTPHARGRRRWNYATSHWDRRLLNYI